MIPTRPVLITAGAALLVSLGVFTFFLVRGNHPSVASTPKPSLAADAALPVGATSSTEETSADASMQASLTPASDEVQLDVPSQDEVGAGATQTDAAAQADASSQTDASSLTKESSQTDASNAQKEPPAPVSPQEGSQTYTNTLYGYTFDVPTDWHHDAETTPTAWIASFSSFDPAAVKSVNDLPGAKLEVLVQENTEGSSLAQLADSIASQASAVHARSDTTLAGQPAIQLTVDLPSGQAFIVVVLRDMDAFTLSFTGRDATKQETVFQSILKSFTL